MIMEYVTGRLLVPYFVLQFAVGAIFPMLLLSFMIWRRTTGKPLIAGVTLSACLVMFSVFMMRWNVVIGGQAFSLSFAGFMHYHLPIVPHDLETFKEGLFGALTVAATPFVIFYFLSKIFPIFLKEDDTHGKTETAKPGVSL